jgi:hypothetical protein
MHAACRKVSLADVDQSAQKGSRGQNDGSAPKLPPISQNNSLNASLDNLEIKDLGFNNIERLDGLEFSLHGGPVEAAIGLCTRSSDRWAFAPVQQPKLYTSGIGNPPHQAVQSINLANKVTLAQAADSRVA